MMAIPLPRDVEKLLTQYLDPLSSSHLLSSQDRLLKNIQRDSELYPMSVDTIQNFKQSLEWESKIREFKLLRGKKRYLSYRRYITFDNSMLAGLDNRPILSIYLSIYLSVCLSLFLTFFPLLFQKRGSLFYGGSGKNHKKKTMQRFNSHGHAFKVCFSKISI